MHSYNESVGMQGLFSQLKQQFQKTEYLSVGTPKQQAIGILLYETKLLERLLDLQPLLAGTFPLALEIENSDIDLLCHYRDETERQGLVSLLQKMEQNIEWQFTDQYFTARWNFKGWPIELYASTVPTADQAAFRHLLIEAWLLEKHGHKLKATVLHLKEQGLKTEPAFAQVLSLPGDPYAALLRMAEEIEKNNLQTFCL